jgi:hypothetical protein
LLIPATRDVEVLISDLCRIFRIAQDGELADDAGEAQGKIPDALAILEIPDVGESVWFANESARKLNKLSHFSITVNMLYVRVEHMPYELN